MKQWYAIILYAPEDREHKCDECGSHLSRPMIHKFMGFTQLDPTDTLDIELTLGIRFPTVNPVNLTLVPEKNFNNYPQIPKRGFTNAIGRD